MPTLDTLWCLRIYGPCTARDLESRVDPRTRTATPLVTVCTLVARGLAAKLPGPLYDITPRGRVVLAERERARKRWGWGSLPAWARADDGRRPA